MSKIPRDSRYSTRDGDTHFESTHREGDSRRHRDRRSQSPKPKERDSKRHRDRRSRSPKSKERDSRRHRSPHKNHGSVSRSSNRTTHASEVVKLPFSARQLVREDLAAFEPLFADYLSLQKQKDIQLMDEREVKGRWKSFVGKWNRGELAQGWYDPEMFQRILEREPVSVRRETLETESSMRREEIVESDEADDGDDDGYGPVLPGAVSRSRRAGVSIPSKEDLELRDELIEESKEEERENLRALRKADRKIQKERLEDLVPRAEAGTHERKLEKRQEVNAKMKQFREKSPGMEVNEKELMGGGDSLEEYKRTKQQEQRRKTEREVMREEMQRAKNEEFEERRRAWREREDKTVEMLKELARQRFG